jgi:uncharacterized protein YvpB
VSAKQIAFRVQTIAYGNLVIWIVVAVVLVMGVASWRSTQTKKREEYSIHGINIIPFNGTTSIVLLDPRGVLLLPNVDF